MVYLWAVKATDINNDGASEERAARWWRSTCLPNSACRRCSYKHFLSRPAITALSWWHHRIARVSLDEFTAHMHAPMLWTLRNTLLRFFPAEQVPPSQAAPSWDSLLLSATWGSAWCAELIPDLRLPWTACTRWLRGADLQGHWSQLIIQLNCGHHTLAQWAGWALVWWPCGLTPALFLLPPWVPWPLMPSRCLPASTQLGISFQRNQYVIYMASNSKNTE